MTDYSENYNRIFKLFTNLTPFSVIKEEVKIWLINEREDNVNSLDVIQLEILLKEIIQFGYIVNQAIDFVDCCSFNLNIDFVSNFKNKLRRDESILNITNSLNQINQCKQYIQISLQRVDIHMVATYDIKPYSEVLKNLNETDFINITKGNIYLLQDKLNELKYVTPKHLQIHELIERMLQSLNGIKHTQKHINTLNADEKNFIKGALNKHISIEKSLIHDLQKLKLLSIEFI